MYEKRNQINEINISKNDPILFIDYENIGVYLLTKKIVVTSSYYPRLTKKEHNCIKRQSYKRTTRSIIRSFNFLLN